MTHCERLILKIGSNHPIDLRIVIVGFAMRKLKLSTISMLEIRLLGQFAIQLDGAPIDMNARPAQSLFAYLALNAGVAQRRERLAGLLWPDSNEANARRNLRQALWQIRRAFGIYSDTILLVDDVTITFNTQADYQLDAALLARQMEGQSSIEVLVAAVALYSGELLPGFYEDWVALERERLQTIFERKMNLLLEALVQAGRWAEVLDWGERWIALGHTPEPAYRALMLAHAAQGAVGNVAEVYRRCVEALARDLDVEPSAQTHALYKQLRRGAAPPTPAATPAPPTQPRHNLPGLLTSFIGRKEELAEICRLLTPHAPASTPERTAPARLEVRLLTLTGPGGAGKTRLALQAATSLTTKFPDGIWLVELAQLADPELLPQTIAAVLTVREEPNYSATRALIDYARPKSLLLILDNCEHLLNACAQLIDALVRACPYLKILVTSRETLGITGETVLRVPSLSLPNPDRLPPLAEAIHYEAIRLFVDRATTVRPEFQLTMENIDAVAQICHQVDGIPLAIELAAARIQAMTAQQIAQRLDDRFRLLTGGSRTALPRQQTLRATMDWSWDLLSEAERLLLRRLAVFRNGWLLEAAEVVCAGDSLAEGDIMDLLTHLVEKSLVVVEEQGGMARYSLLETIQQYAREKLLNVGEATKVRARHLDYFLQLSEAAAPSLRTGEQLLWLARLDKEHDNLRMALKWAKSSDLFLNALHLAGNLAVFWYLRGYWKEGREWFKHLLAAEIHDADALALASARIKALHGAAWLADEDGSEIALYAESLAYCQQIGDRWGEAFALRGLGASNTTLDNLEDAAPHLKASLAAFQELEDAWGIGLALFNLGWWERGHDQHQAAQAYWQQGLAAFQESGDRWGIAVTQAALGYNTRFLGDYSLAAELMQTSLATFRELGDKAGIALSLFRLGNLAFRRSDYVEAGALLQESLILQRVHGDSRGVFIVLQILGWVACLQGDFSQALKLLEESLAVAQERGVELEIADGQGELAFVLYHQGNLMRAAPLFQESLARFQQIEERKGIAYATAGLGFVALRQGDFPLARERFATALELCRAWGDKHYIAITLNGLGMLAQAQGDPNTALDHQRESLVLRIQIGNKQGIAESLERFASLAHCPEQAIHFLAAAAALRQMINAPVLPVDQIWYDQEMQRRRAELGEDDFAAAWAVGQNLSYEQAAASALQGIMIE